MKSTNTWKKNDSIEKCRRKKENRIFILIKLLIKKIQKKIIKESEKKWNIVAKNVCREEQKIFNIFFLRYILSSCTFLSCHLFKSIFLYKENWACLKNTRVFLCSVTFLRIWNVELKEILKKTVKIEPIPRSSVPKMSFEYHKDNKIKRLLNINTVQRKNDKKSKFAELIDMHHFRWYLKQRNVWRWNFIKILICVDGLFFQHIGSKAELAQRENLKFIIGLDVPVTLFVTYFEVEISVGCDICFVFFNLRFRQLSCIRSFWFFFILDNQTYAILFVL